MDIGQNTKDTKDYAVVTIILPTTTIPSYLTPFPWKELLSVAYLPLQT